MNRIIWVDIAKGISIILVVIGHSGGVPNVISKYIYAFHMPIFFILAGITTSWTKLNYSQFTVHKLQTLLLPFVCYSILFLFLYPIYGMTKLSEYTIHILKNGWGGVALWFIPCFFFAIMTNKFISSRFLIPAGCLLGALGWALAFYQCNLPWALSTIPIATVFVILGRFTAVFWKKQVRSIPFNIIFPMILLTGGLSFYISQYFRLDMASNSILPFFPIFIAAISGSVSIMLISIFIEHYFKFSTKILTYIGRNTFVILALSQSLIMILNRFMADHQVIKYLAFTLLLIVIIQLKNAINYFSARSFKLNL